MASPGFYNDNLNRAFPFVKGTASTPLPAFGAISMSQLPASAVVDCGFILGPESGFDAAEHRVYLSYVYRVGNLFYFSFATTAPRVTDSPLLFVADLTSPLYSREFVDSDIPVYTAASQSASASLSVSLTESPECGEPFWSGYCVFGDLSALAARLATGERLDGDTASAVVEPALIQNLNNSQVVSINVANGDRTRSLAPVGCPERVWPFPIIPNYVNKECLQGPMVLRAGYNVSLTQNNSSNTINISPVLNAGAGKLCHELKLFDAERPPLQATNDLLDGDYTCGETFRTINGLQGPTLTFFAGSGVSIVASEVPNELSIDVNLNDLSICDIISVSESL